MPARHNMPFIGQAALITAACTSLSKITEGRMSNAFQNIGWYESLFLLLFIAGAAISMMREGWEEFMTDYMAGIIVFQGAAMIGFGLYWTFNGLPGAPLAPILAVVALLLLLALALKLPDRVPNPDIEDY